MWAFVSRGIGPLERRPWMDEKTVPVHVPVWEDADRVRPWDGSAKAQAWASLMNFR